MINVLTFQLFCMFTKFIIINWGKSPKALVSWYWATCGLWAWSSVQWLYWARMMCNFLCPPSLASSFYIPGDKRQGLGQLLPRSATHATRCQAALGGLSTWPPLPFPFLFSLGAAFLFFSPFSWHHGVQLHCFGTRKGETRKSNKYITRRHWRGL